MPKITSTKEQREEKQKLIDNLYALGMSKNRFGFFSDYFQVEYEKTVKQLNAFDEQYDKKLN